MQKVSFQKSQKLLTETLPRKDAYSEHSMAIHSISMSGYVTAVLAFVHAELRGRETSSFCNFFKVTFCDFTLFYSFFTQPNIFFQMCLVRNTIGCVQIWFILILWILVSVALKKRCFFWRSVCVKSLHMSSIESQKGVITIHWCSVEN